MIEELTQFWMKQYPNMTYEKARAWAEEQADEAENG
jgi:hypothetical protein